MLASLTLGTLLLAGFLRYEAGRKAPMLPLRFFRSRAFSSTQALSFAMFFGTFGSIFLLSQFFQTAQGFGPFEAGARTLPWTAMPMFVAPIAGLLSDRIGTRPLMFAGMTLQAAGLAWLALIIDPANGFTSLIPPFVMCGSGMALVFPTAAATVLASVRPIEAGKASGANNAIREIGGVMGVAVLASVFAANGGYESPAAFTDGVQAALPVAVGVLAVGAVLALLVPGKRRMGQTGGKFEHRLRSTLEHHPARGHRLSPADRPSGGIEEQRGRGRTASRTCGRSGSRESAARRPRPRGRGCASPRARDGESLRHRHLHPADRPGLETARI